MSSLIVKDMEFENKDFRKTNVALLRHHWNFVFNLRAQPAFICVLIIFKENDNGAKKRTTGTFFCF